MGCDTQAAVGITNDLLSSRLHQFENTAVVEVPLMFAEQAVDLSARLHVLRYIKGLQDWQAGALEWHMRSSRAMNASSGLSRLSLGPTGIGTSASRLVVMPRDGRRRGSVRSPGQVADELSCAFTLPSWYMPFKARCNPLLHEMRRVGKDWAVAMGMIGPDPFALWSEPGFDGMDLALFAANTHPDSSREELALVTQWDVWAFSVDDYFYQTFKRRSDLPGARAFIARLPLFMPLDGVSAPPPGNPVERGLADVWARTAPTMPGAFRREFPEHVVDYA